LTFLSLTDPKICLARFSMARLGPDAPLGCSALDYGEAILVLRFDLFVFFETHQRACACENTLDSCARET
jgi:hypothetical protein